MKSRKTAAGQGTIDEKSWERLNERIVACRRCTRLLDHCREIGRVKRKAYREDVYWARPVPNFGSNTAAILIVGLAPGAHGANRTGRMFTGDQSGIWLFRALHRAGLATKPHSESRDDDLRLVNCAITAVCHCAPPNNKPMVDEIANCRSWIDDTISLSRPRLILALGQIGWNSVIHYSFGKKWLAGRRPSFGHGRSFILTDTINLLGSYHPSQQNTFTGRLTEVMLDEIMVQAKQMANI